MTDLTPIRFSPTDIDKIAAHEGRIAVFVNPEGRLDAGARRVNKLMRGALARLVEGEAFAKMKPGQSVAMAYPAGLAAEAVDVVHLPRRISVKEARRAGASLAKARGTADLLVLARACAGCPRWPLALRCATTVLKTTRARRRIARAA
jgi:hypothetical protein